MTESSSAWSRSGIVGLTEVDGAAVVVEVLPDGSWSIVTDPGTFSADDLADVAVAGLAAGGHGLAVVGLARAGARVERG